MQRYGIVTPVQAGKTPVQSINDVELERQGFTILQNLLSDADVAIYRQATDETMKQQEGEFGVDRLAAISESDMVRSPLRYDSTFAKLAAHPDIISIVQRHIAGKVILNSQNGIINRPGVGHHQAAWHRDLPYQTFVASRPLAISVMVALDPFTEATGGTHVLPGSHLHEDFPGDEYVTKHLAIPELTPGSALVFNAMLFHRAGVNRSDIIRRGVNHVYSIPLMRPQVALHDLEDLGDPVLRMLFGRDFTVAANTLAWRERRWDLLPARQEKPVS